MATKRVELVTDDLDGSVLAPLAAESLTFGIDGETYEIDLSSANAAALREILSPYTAVARTTSIGDRDVETYTRTELPRVEDKNQIRVWARKNGHKVSPRGSLSKTVREAYANRNA